MFEIKPNVGSFNYDYRIFNKGMKTACSFYATGPLFFFLFFFFAADILSFHSGKTQVELITSVMAPLHCCVPVSRVCESACTDPGLTHLKTHSHK